MERRYPVIDIGLNLAERLLGPFLGAPRPCSLTLLAGGHINTNYVVSLDDGQRVVLRIYARGETAAFHKEVAVLRALEGSVPVPRVHLAAREPELLPYPYAVLEWIGGSSLTEVLSSHSGAAAEIGEALASTLLRIGEHALPAHPFAPFLDSIRDYLFEQGAARHLGTESASRLWHLVQEESPWLDELCRTQRLVHGDFQGDNILLEETAGHWRVAAVLDWEWAHNSCYLRDLGSLLRYDREGCLDFQGGLERSFLAAGAPLPSEWRRAARIWDLAAHCEKLATPRHRGEVTLRSIRIIEQCLRDYAN